MLEALKEARKAYDIEEVPIGAVVVKDGKVIGRGHNLKERDKDPTAHAEILAIREACEFLGGWRLTGCELYVTIEPCMMCCGAIYQSRIAKLVYGSDDPKAGCVNSINHLLEDDRLNHMVEVDHGVLESQCSQIMKDFFRRLR
ncbi:MAG: tRNA adenosine(34) deaminase TadA [Firmicutes bacterium]|jgi:tRNA(adenine34) deaminase|nr:tRNA adenosine(34) deaminase TadA [Bacillota bacterium]